MHPILSGRDTIRLEAQADILRMEYRPISVNDRISSEVALAALTYGGFHPWIYGSLSRGFRIELIMKERYFTIQSLEHQARALYQQVAEISQQKAISFQPQRSALLVLDMQDYFLNASSHAYIPSAEAILDGIVQLIKAYSIHGRPIIFTQHINTTGNAGMMSHWWKDLITSQNPLHKIIPEINLTLGTLIHKSQYDAFYQTHLDELLYASGVTQVVLCGVMTHLCCETTARSAFMHGFEVFFPVDGTATYNLAFHRASLLNLAHGFANLVFMRDLLVTIRGDNEG
jgi:bifunctional isochorismate lyase/aryl carrier protein